VDDFGLMTLFDSDHVEECLIGDQASSPVVAFGALAGLARGISASSSLFWFTPRCDIRSSALGSTRSFGLLALLHPWRSCA